MRVIDFNDYSACLCMQGSHVNSKEFALKLPFRSQLSYFLKDIISN